MCSIVLPWYPGGHVLSKMQGPHLISKTGMRRDPKTKYIKQKKNMMTATLSKSAAKNRCRRNITRTKIPSPIHPRQRPLPDRKTEMPVPII